MIEVEPEAIEAEQLSQRLRNARRQTGRSAADCAHALDMTAEQYAAAEEGRLALSLPQFEALAMVLGVPLATFWGGDAAGPLHPDDFSEYLILRDRMIGLLLQRARLAAGMSRADLAGASGLDESQIEAYEQGRSAIPFPDLARLADGVRLALHTFIDEQRGPLAAHEAQWRPRRATDQLPPHLQALIVDPAQMGYLEAAYRLSQTDPSQLQSLAHLLLDITSDGGSS